MIEAQERQIRETKRWDIAEGFLVIILKKEESTFAYVDLRAKWTYIGVDVAM